jgi:hypothetical protein
VDIDRRRENQHVDTNGRRESQRVDTKGGNSNFTINCENQESNSRPWALIPCQASCTTNVTKSLNWWKGLVQSTYALQQPIYTWSWVAGVLTPLTMHLVSVLPPSMLASRLAWDLFPASHVLISFTCWWLSTVNLFFWSDTWLFLYLSVVLPFCWILQVPRREEKKEKKGKNTFSFRNSFPCLLYVIFVIFFLFCSLM